MRREVNSGALMGVKFGSQLWGRGCACLVPRQAYPSLHPELTPPPTQHRHTFAETSRTLVETASKLAEEGQIVAEPGQMSASLPKIPVECPASESGRGIWRTSSQAWPKLAPSRPEFGRSRGRCGGPMRGPLPVVACFLGPPPPLAHDLAQHRVHRRWGIVRGLRGALPSLCRFGQTCPSTA